MNNRPIKAASKEFTAKPFHFIESNGTEKRYVVLLLDKIRIRTLIAGFINQSKKDIQIEITDSDNPEQPIDYFGSLSKSKLHELMTKHEDVIFHNGFHDLMLCNPDSGDYLVFDEHGLIYIYTDNDYSEILKNLEAYFSPNEKLIYEFNHWHYCLPEGSEKLADMIKDFGLEKE
jgi:hypothetical protein